MIPREYLTSFVSFAEQEKGIYCDLDYAPKDIQRLEKIYSHELEKTMIAKARTQGKLIKDISKAVRRAYAAVIVGERLGINENTIMAVVKMFVLCVANNAGFTPVQIAQARIKGFM